ncbi:akirin-1-like isoform X2 [Leptonychotes weddellii]|uniref:Akirin-1-like isoform X2 n=1 Tax=Leptonychotes weddellii TaxID=9713 RepID=A0A7F8Q9R7_LEPWE|nr:akirin-1-like isoform X2 [Leptonychotes weddellii]
MACGATLKRPMEFEAALLSPGSPKRRRCAPLPGPTPGLRPPDAEPPLLLHSQTPPPTLQQPAPPGNERRLPTPQQSFQNIKQEYSRYQRWRHLEVVLNQSEARTSESQPHSSALTAPSSPEQYESSVKFTRDQIMRRYGTRPTSHVSRSFLAYLGTRFDLKR